MTDERKACSVKGCCYVAKTAYGLCNMHTLRYIQLEEDKTRLQKRKKKHKPMDYRAEVKRQLEHIRELEDALDDAESENEVLREILAIRRRL
jgi:hypothetical protein